MYETKYKWLINNLDIYLRSQTILPTIWMENWKDNKNFTGTNKSFFSAVFSTENIIIHIATFLKNTDIWKKGMEMFYQKERYCHVTPQNNYGTGRH